MIISPNSLVWTRELATRVCQTVEVNRKALIRAFTVSDVSEKRAYAEIRECIERGEMHLYKSPILFKPFRYLLCMNFSGVVLSSDTMDNLHIPNDTQSLRMDSCSINDTRLTHFFRTNERNLYNLKELSLVSNQITDYSVGLFSIISTNCSLDLTDNYITIEGLLHLNKRVGNTYLDGNLIIGLSNQNLPRLPQVRASCYMVQEYITSERRRKQYIDEVYGEGTWSRFKLCTFHHPPAPPVLNISKITTC